MIGDIEGEVAQLAGTLEVPVQITALGETRDLKLRVTYGKRDMRVKFMDLLDEQGRLLPMSAWASDVLLVPVTNHLAK